MKKAKKRKTVPFCLALEVNALAGTFYAMQGYNAKPGHEFQNSTHPQEILMWNMALMAYSKIRPNSDDLYKEYGVF